jgi:hypothetical protein
VSGGDFPAPNTARPGHWLGSDKDVVATIPGGSIVHVTTNDLDFVTQCKSVGLLYLTALQVWIDRNTKG